MGYPQRNWDFKKTIKKYMREYERKKQALISSSEDNKELIAD